MKRVLFALVMISFFMGATAISSLAAPGHKAHHPGGESASSQGMMGQQEMAQMPCMAAKTSGTMPQMMGKGMGDMMDAGMPKMMGAGKMGMMKQRMAHMFFLDRIDELGLTPEQTNKLKALHSECRRDNIRNSAEAKIARLELTDLLAANDWSLKDVEPRVRKVQKLEGDIQVRHLKALSDARKVLTPEQLKQARSGDNSDNLESLFQ